MGYWDTVESIAHEAIEEYPHDEEDREQYVRDSVDGSSYIIYYSENEEVLQLSDNEPDGAEVAEVAGPDADWRRMRTVAAYLAMEMDVLEKMRKLVEEREEAVA